MENSSTLPLGHRIKEYSLEGILGQGGFGIVYRGIHTQLREEVVIKELLPSELAGRNGSQVVAFGASKAQIFDDCMGRFVEEGRTLRKLQHKNIVSCRDLFTANGTAYLVMDYEDGMPLDSLTRQIEQQDKQYTEEELLHFLIPLAEGIAYIHSKGVLHRDIKPANVYIRRSDGSPVLLDFGSAKQNYAETTQSKAPFTEFYAPLEQIEGGGEAKASIDIYAFGGLMYRLITGGVGPKAETRAMAIVYGKPDPLGETKPWNVQISKELCLLVDKCLAFKPSERPPSMDEVIRVLKRIKSNKENYCEYKPKVKRQIKYKDFERIQRDVHAALGTTGQINSRDRAKIFIKAASFGLNKVDVESYIASVEKNYLEGISGPSVLTCKENHENISVKNDAHSNNKERMFEVFKKGNELFAVDNEDNDKSTKIRDLLYNECKPIGIVYSTSSDGAIYYARHKLEMELRRKNQVLKKEVTKNKGGNSTQRVGVVKNSEERLNIWVLLCVLIVLLFGAYSYDSGSNTQQAQQAQQAQQLEQYRIVFQVSPKISAVEVYNRNTYKSTSVGHGTSWFEKGDYKVTVRARGYETEVRYVSIYKNSTLKFDLNKSVETEPKKQKHAPNDIKAVKWFKESANQGNAKAQYNLASMYEQGRGVDKDMTQAVRWYVKSAKQGNKDAQSKLKAMGKSWN